MRIAVFCDDFGAPSETFVVNEIAAMRRLGHEVQVVSESPGGADHVLGAAPRARKALAGMRLAAARPVACARDAADRRRWRPQEDPRRLAALAPTALALQEWGVEHVHAHFAAGAAMHALRIGALLGVPVSVTAHAYEIFATPRNLARKLRRAAFVTSGCDYNVRHLRSVAGPGHDIHEIVMGVDADVFRRMRPPADSRHVVSVGRLVEKKGFDILLDAVAQLDCRLSIVGDGPLEAGLRAQAGPNVEFAGTRTPDEIRTLLEDAAVFALPCVIAADGDRDSMPVVLKEAMAMEIPVVASDLVGIPELVDDSVGRLVPPGDAAALATALTDLLDLPPDARAALGGAGRARVKERADVNLETAKLLALIAATRRQGRSAAWGRARSRG